MTESVYKLEIFLPEDHFDPICQALWSVDAGHIGQYDRCLSWSRVNSCWRPLAGTDPYLGSRCAAWPPGWTRPLRPSNRPIPMRSR